MANQRVEIVTDFEAFAAAATEAGTLLPGTLHRLVKFKNGFGVSIIHQSRHLMADNHFFELVVVRFERDSNRWDFCGYTAVTPDGEPILGWRELDESVKVCRQVFELPVVR